MKKSPENRRKFSPENFLCLRKSMKERPNSDNARAFQGDRPRCIVVKTYWYHTTGFTFLCAVLAVCQYWVST